MPLTLPLSPTFLLVGIISISSKRVLAATFETDRKSIDKVYDIALTDNEAFQATDSSDRLRSSRGRHFLKGIVPKDSALLESQSRSRATDLSPKVDLSALHSLSGLRRPQQPLETFSSPPSHGRSQSGTYYAAAWGSPYATPSPPRPSIGGNRANTIDGGLHDLSPSSARSGGSQVSSRGIANLLSLSARGPLHTGPIRVSDQKEPVSSSSSRPFLSSKSERGNWLSDSEGSAAGSHRGKRKSFDRRSQDWLDIGEDSLNEDDLQTPTANRFSERKLSDKHNIGTNHIPVNHQSRDSSVTIRQADISGLRSIDQTRPSVVSTMSTKTRNDEESEKTVGTKMQSEVKPLPNLPSELVEIDEKNPRSADTRPPIPSAPSFQRPKKRVICKGKACIIALPLNDERGSITKLLSPADVATRMKEWTSFGYDTDGFLLEDNGQNGEAASQSRSLFPDPNDVQYERTTAKYRVSIPKKAEWDAWIRHLKEEKLKALGVTFGDEEPVRTTQSPASGQMSRSSSHHPSLPISPPVPSSTASSHVLSGFSPAFNPSTKSTSQQGSIGSSNSQYGPHRGQPSIAVPPVEKHNVSPMGPIYQPAPPVGRMNSPGYFAPHGGVSPLGPANMKNLGEVLSPVSPFQMDERDMSPQPSNTLNQLKQQQLPQQPQVPQVPQTLPSYSQLQPQLPWKPLGPQSDSWRRGPGFNEIIGHSNVEIAHPTPGRHNRNVSEALEREIDASEDPLEIAIRKQLQNHDEKEVSVHQETPLVNVDSDMKSGIDGIIEPNPASIGTNLSGNGLQIAMDGNGLTATETAESHAAHALHDKLRPDKITQSAPTQVHESKFSASGFNVEAKEFSFNPEATFRPRNVSSTSDDLNPTTVSFDPSLSKSHIGPSSNIKPGSGSYSSGFNVEAPSFMPSGQLDTKTSTAEFKFGSGLKVDAPIFNPTLPVFNAREEPAPVNKEPNSGPRIFGDFKFEGAAKSSRRSKAIPIVRPDDTDSESQRRDELEEDEAGRLGPSEANRKRIRRFGSDGERTVTLPESPSALNEVSANASPVDEFLKERQRTPMGKENVVEDGIASDVIESNRALNEPGSSVRPSPGVSESDVTDEKTDLSSFIVSGPELETHSTDGPENSTEAVEKTRSDLEGRSSSETDVPSSPPSAPAKHQFRPSLSATAKPFEPQSSLASGLERLVRSDGPSPRLPDSGLSGTMVETAPPRKLGGLESSRYATIDSSSSESELEKAMERMLDAQEASHAIKNGTSSDTDGPSSDQLSQAMPSSETEGPSNLPEALNSTLGAIPHEPAEISPSFTEIDAVMKQLNEADSELGIERSDGPIPVAVSTPVLVPTTRLRSDAPSPSPDRAHSFRSQHVPQDSTEIDVQSPHYPLGLGIHAPVHNLNKNLDENEASDWNDMLSSADEGKFYSRTQFFDGHVNSLVGGILEDRLAPLERSIDVVQRSLSLLASGPRERANKEVIHSDADDEDDESENIAPFRSRSPSMKRGSRYKGDQIKKAVMEALEAHQEAKPSEDPHLDLSRIYEVLAEMKLLAEPAALQDRAKEMRAVVEDVISTHPRLRGNRAAHDQEHGADKLKLQVDGLETMLKLSNERAENEYQSRKEVDDELAETKRLLSLAEEEAAGHREASEEAERSLLAFHADRKEHEDLQVTVSELSMKNAALERTLDEYRLSHDQWRSDIDDERAVSKELRSTLLSLKKQVFESHEARQGLRGKFERLQEDMAIAARDIAIDHASWSRKEHKMQAENDHLRTAVDDERREKQENNHRTQELLKDHDEIARLRLALEQSQNERTKLEDIVTVLQDESTQHRENLLNTRVQLETQFARSQAELENSRLDADHAKARQEALLTEAIETKIEALTDASQTREEVLQEQSRFHERALNDLRERHARVLHNSTEDRERAERHLQEKLDIVQQKNEFLEDKVNHLEERLEVTKAAAKAAADAATSRGASLPSVVSPPRSSMASMPFAKGTDIPEKISPQALRESIMVLQDQLQNREQSIERLEQELGKVDKDAPEKLKAKDTEITWLRELLGVRLDDLEDIIVTLSQPDFDREAVKDAAIRLKANLQMEQQVKERAATGSSGLSQGISSLTNLTQSPGRLPMAAAAAWGNWRKGAKELPFSSTLSDIASIASQTPSRTNASPQSFLSGLMTPPATNQRQTPTPSTSRTTGPPSMPSSAARPLRTYGSAPRSLSNRQMERRPLRDYSGSGPGSGAGSPPLEPPEPPRTPPLLRKASYDQDAEASSFSAYGDGDDDDRSTVDGRDSLRI